MNHVNRLIELSSKCKEFAGIPITAQEAAKKKGQRPEGNAGRAIVTNLLAGGGYTALPVALRNAGEATAAGQVYRKRDAFTDGAKQTGSLLSGGILGAGIGAGGSLAAHSIEGHLAKKAGRKPRVAAPAPAPAAAPAPAPASTENT